MSSTLGTFKWIRREFRVICSCFGVIVHCLPEDCRYNLLSLGRTSYEIPRNTGNLSGVIACGLLCFVITCVSLPPGRSVSLLRLILPDRIKPSILILILSSLSAIFPSSFFLFSHYFCHSRESRLDFPSARQSPDVRSTPEPERCKVQTEAYVRLCAVAVIIHVVRTFGIVLRRS